MATTGVSFAQVNASLLVNNAADTCLRLVTSAYETNLIDDILDSSTLNAALSQDQTNGMLQHGVPLHLTLTYSLIDRPE